VRHHQPLNVAPLVHGAVTQTMASGLPALAKQVSSACLRYSVTDKRTTRKFATVFPVARQYRAAWWVSITRSGGGIMPAACWFFFLSIRAPVTVALIRAGVPSCCMLRPSAISALPCISRGLPRRVYRVIVAMFAVARARSACSFSLVTQTTTLPGIRRLSAV